MNRRRLLLVYSGWLGDLVWILPTIHALRPAFEFVSLVVSRVQSDLASMLKNRLVDDVILDDPSRRLSMAARARRTALTLGIGAYVDLKGRWKTGIYIPWRPGAQVLLPHRRDAGEYVLSRLLHPWATTMRPRTGAHMVDAYLSSVGNLGIAPPAVSFEVPFDDETRNAGESLAKREELRERTCVALNLGSAQYSKIWPAEFFLRLARILENDLHCKAVIMGAGHFPSNDDYDARMARSVFRDERFTVLVEKTSFAVDSYLLRSGVFALCVGNDSFAGHMAGSADEVVHPTAGAVRAKNGRWYKANHTVSLFGPTNPAYCSPYDPTGAFNTVVTPARYPDDCIYDRQAHTCPHYGDRHCRGASHCMRSLTVEQVAAAVENKLRQIRRTNTQPIQPAGEPRDGNR